MLIDHPDLARSGPSIEDYLDKFAFFIAIALGGNSKNLTKYLIILTTLIYAVPWFLGDVFSNFLNGARGLREGLGLNPIRTAMYLSLFIWTLYGICKACRNRTISVKLRNFIVTTILLFMMTANFHDFFFNDIYGLHILSIVLGTPVSFIYKDQVIQKLGQSYKVTCPA